MKPAKILDPSEEIVEICRRHCGDFKYNGDVSCVETRSAIDWCESYIELSGIKTGVDWRLTYGRGKKRFTNIP